MDDIGANLLRQLFRYDQGTGQFIRLVAVGHLKVGEVAGCVNKTTGYRQIKICGRIYRAHRLAWFYMTGEWPVNEIDHKNGVRDDNRFENLREATRAENMQNLHLTNNTSGYPGVGWCKSRCKWTAGIKIAGKSKNLGRFDTPEDAHAAYVEAKHGLHPFGTLGTELK